MVVLRNSKSILIPLRAEEALPISDPISSTSVHMASTSA